jgi:hypothetical protein
VGSSIYNNHVKGIGAFLESHCELGVYQMNSWNNQRLMDSHNVLHCPSTGLPATGQHASSASWADGMYPLGISQIQVIDPETSYQVGGGAGWFVTGTIEIKSAQEWRPFGY